MSRLARNAVANVAQTVTSAALLFGLYRYVSTTLGVDQLGVWSVVLASTSVSRLADLGLSGGVTRFVARDLGRGDVDRAVAVVDSAWTGLGVLLGVFLPLVYPLVVAVLGFFLQGEALVAGREILPIAMGSLWLTSVGGVAQSGLDGCARMDLRAFVATAGQVCLVVLGVVLVPRWGLLGLAWAQIAQGAVQLVGSRLVLRRILPGIRLMPRWPRVNVLRDMVGYGLKLQVATVAMLFVDPVTKGLIARFGGAGAAGYFEMANQVVVKARSVIVSANQAVVPRVAELAEGEPSSVVELYRTNVRALMLVTLPVFSLLAAWAGWASWMVSGGYSGEFVLFLFVSILGWGLNTVGAPAYLLHVGNGDVGWNALSHVVMGVWNAAAGWVLGTALGPLGVAIAFATAIAIGGWLPIAALHIRSRIPWASMQLREHRVLMAAALVVAIASWLQPMRAVGAVTVGSVIWAVGPPLVLGAAIWTHPAIRRLRLRRALAQAKAASR